MKLGVPIAIIFALSAFSIGVPIPSTAGVAPDGDSDGIPDVLDKCSADSRNVAASCDTDCDGYGNPCDADFDQSGTVTGVDFGSYFLPSFKTGAPAATATGTDMDCSGTMTGVDFGSFFLPKFKGGMGGPFPGPSGVDCAGQAGCGCAP